MDMGAGVERVPAKGEEKVGNQTGFQTITGEIHVCINMHKRTPMS